MRLIRLCGHSFIPHLLTKTGVVLDCGANHGEFSRWVSENTLAHVHAFEPDPRLFPALPALPRVTYHEVAIAQGVGNMKIRLGETRCSSLHYAENAKQVAIDVKTISIEEFCNENAISEVDLIKIDIEGEELPVLLSMSRDFLLSVKQLTVEFHDFIRREDLPKIRQVIGRLESLGFYWVSFGHYSFGDVMFVNRRLVPVPAIVRLKIKIFDKYGPGILRHILRRLGLPH